MAEALRPAPLLQLVSNKVAARDYIVARVGPDYLVPSLGVFEKPEDIPWADLAAPYVIKAAHGYGWNLFVFDSAEADPVEMTRTLRELAEDELLLPRKRVGLQTHPEKPRARATSSDPAQGPAGLQIPLLRWGAAIDRGIYDRLTQPRATCYDTEWSVLPVQHGMAPEDL